MSFLSKIRNFILFPLKLWDDVISFFYNSINGLKSFIRHFKILREANISLGKLHLQNGNFSDAKLRFKIIDKIIAPNDPENLYWYSWSCVMLSNYAESLSVLKDTKFKDDIIRNYISNMSSVPEIPEKIIQDYNFITSDYFEDRYFSDEENLFQKATSSLIPYLPAKDSNVKFNILEIGAHPYWIDDMLSFFPKNTSIDTIVFDRESFEKTRSYNSTTRIYNNILESERYKFEKIDSKYDVILAFDSISTTTKLSDIFKEIKKNLIEGGMIMFVIPKHSTVKLDPSMNHFKYSQSHIIDNLKLADFSLTSITSISLSKTLEYYIVIAK